MCVDFPFGTTDHYLVGSKFHVEQVVEVNGCLLASHLVLLNTT